MLREEIKNIGSSRRDLRNFGLTVGTVLAALALVFWWSGKSLYPYLLVPGAVLVFGGLFFPALLKPLQKAWMTLAVIMGWVMTRVILSALFFLVVTPMGLLARLFGKDFLSLKRKSSRESYWHLREDKEYDRRRSEMQF